MLSFCPFEVSVGVGTFAIGQSQISSFFLMVSVNSLSERRFIERPQPSFKPVISDRFFFS